jgi:hypothetical protein
MTFTRFIPVILLILSIMGSPTLVVLKITSCRTVYNSKKEEIKIKIKIQDFMDKIDLLFWCHAL